MDFLSAEGLKTCCLSAAVAAVVAYGVAQYFPNFSSKLPAGALRTLYLTPLNFGLAVGVVVMLATYFGLINNQASDYNYYSNLLHPETYGYSTYGAKGADYGTKVGLENGGVQFKNYVT